MITRRDFLKIGAAVFAGTAASKVATDTFDSPLYADSVKDLKPDKKVPTFCEICFWKCGMLASVKNGKIIKVEGNPDHPLSNGRLCPRGTSARGIIYDKDRLQTPLSERNQHPENKSLKWLAGIKHSMKQPVDYNK